MREPGWAVRPAADRPPSARLHREAKEPSAMREPGPSAVRRVKIGGPVWVGLGSNYGHF